MISSADLPTEPHYNLKPESNNRLHVHSCVTPLVKQYYLGTGILTCYPSTTPGGLALGTD